MPRNPALRIALATALALPACAGGGTVPAAPADGSAEPADAPSSPAAPGADPAAAAAAPGANSPAAAAVPEFPAPAALPEGDRWFVAVRGERLAEPMAERRRVRTVDGVLREEVTWGKSFAEVAAARHGIVQVFAVRLDARGVSVGILGEDGKLSGEAALEVATPLRPGTRWVVEHPSGSALFCEIEAVEEVDTPGGRVRALRVVVRSPAGRPCTMTTWYDEGLRPVRAEVRAFGSRELLEARAALASPTPTPEECRAALEWAAKNFAK